MLSYFCTDIGSYKMKILRFIIFVLIIGCGAENSSHDKVVINSEPIDNSKTPLAQEYSKDTITTKYEWENDSSHYYWQFKDEKNGLKNNRLDTFINKWFSYFLCKFQAVNLSKKYLGNEIYRFTWLRTFHNPIIIQIEKKSSGIFLNYKISNGYGGYDFKEIISDSTYRINVKEWKKIKSLVSICDFWNLPTDQNKITEDDGSESILEGHHKNGYHMVFRWGGEDIGTCCSYFVKLANIDIPKDEFY